MPLTFGSDACTDPNCKEAKKNWLLMKGDFGRRHFSNLEEDLMKELDRFRTLPETSYFNMPNEELIERANRLAHYLSALSGYITYGEKEEDDDLEDQEDTDGIYDSNFENGDYKYMIGTGLTHEKEKWILERLFLITTEISDSIKNYQQNVQKGLYTK